MSQAMTPFQKIVSDHIPNLRSLAITILELLALNVQCAQTDRQCDEHVISAVHYVHLVEIINAVKSANAVNLKEYCQKAKLSGTRHQQYYHST